MTAIPVIAIVKKRRLFEDSFASLSAGLSFLEDPAALSCIPLQLNSWLYLSRSLTYLLQRSHISVRFPHTSWCSGRSIAGNGNSQNSQVTILWGQLSPSWIYKILRSIVSLHNEQATCTIHIFFWKAEFDSISQSLLGTPGNWINYGELPIFLNFLC